MDGNSVISIEVYKYCVLIRCFCFLYIRRYDFNMVPNEEPSLTHTFIVSSVSFSTKVEAQRFAILCYI
jgi:hypothetical protein